MQKIIKFIIQFLIKIKLNVRKHTSLIESKIMEKYGKPEPKPTITRVHFNDPRGIMLDFPNGKFLQYVQDAKGVARANDSDYHIVGITDIKREDYGLVFTVKGKQVHVLNSSIASFLIE